jgi:hypothetical protein
MGRVTDAAPTKALITWLYQAGRKPMGRHEPAWPLCLAGFTLVASLQELAHLLLPSFECNNMTAFQAAQSVRKIGQITDGLLPPPCYLVAASLARVVQTARAKLAAFLLGRGLMRTSRAYIRISPGPAISES